MSQPIASQRYGKAARRFVVVLGVLAAIAALLPTLITKTSLRNTLISDALRSSGVSVSTESASWGWFTAGNFAGVKIQDASGQPLLTTESITIDRTLWELITNWQDLGSINVDAPKVYLAVRADGSNLEDALEALCGSDLPEEPADRRTPMASLRRMPQALVRIENAEVHLVDAMGPGRWRVESLSANLDTRAVNEGLMRMEIAGRLVPADVPRGEPWSVLPAGEKPGPEPGSFSLLLKPADQRRLQLDMQTGLLPLEALLPWLRRFVEQPQLSGFAIIDGYAVWSLPPTSGTWAPADFASGGQLSVEQFDFTSPALAGDHIRLPAAEAPWQITGDGNSLRIDEIALRTDVGELVARGQVPPPAFRSGDPSLGIRTSELDVQGSLSLAKLAAMLPSALQVREGTTITAGEIELTLRSRPFEGGQRLSGSVETSQLSAVNRGSPINWQQPLRTAFETTVQGNQFQIELFRCDSDFCRLDLQGDDRDLRAHAEIDLNVLAERLGQFLDMDRWQPAGTVKADLSWIKTPQNGFGAEGTFQLSGFRLQSHGRTVWAEPQLTMVTEVAGTLDPESRPLIVNSAHLRLQAEADSLELKLREAVNIQLPGSAWLLAMRGRGDLSRWVDRTRPVIALERWQVEGKLDMTADMRLASEFAGMREAKLMLTDVRAASPSWQIDEPRIEFSGDLEWDRRHRHLVSRASQLVSSTVAWAAEDVAIAVPAGEAPSARGTLALRADLSRLSRLRGGGENGRPSHRLSGEIVGNLRFAGQPNELSADLDVQSGPITLARRSDQSVQQPAEYRTIWEEPQLVVRGRASYRKDLDQLSLDQMRLESQTVSATTSGVVDRVSTARQLDLRGSVDYDLGQLTQLLSPLWGDGIQLAGREQANFEIVGPLHSDAVAARSSIVRPVASAGPPRQHWSRALRGRLRAPWKGAQLFGLPIGSGAIVAELSDGGVQFAPLSFAVGDGHLKMSPQLHLDPPPSDLSLPPEEVITNVRISREVSDAMLKYIAPVVADATSSEGVFSMQLQGGRVPLKEPGQADIAGQLVIHSLGVKPGRSTKVWVGLAQQIEALISKRDPQALVNQPPQALVFVEDRIVPFRLVDGRVYHEGMEFYIGEVVVRSRGWVALDESMQLTLEVPILEKWVADVPVLAGLRGQSVQIPVAGTLSRPRVDARAVTSLSTQLLQGMAQETLGGELNKALNRLLGR